MLKTRNPTAIAPPAAKYSRRSRFRLTRGGSSLPARSASGQMAPVRTASRRSMIRSGKTRSRYLQIQGWVRKTLYG